MGTEIRVENPANVVTIAAFAALLSTVPLTPSRAVAPGSIPLVAEVRVENESARFPDRRVRDFDVEVESPRFVSSGRRALAARGFERRFRRR